MRSVVRWVDQETGLVSIFRRFIEEPLPKGTGWAQVFGSIVLFLFCLQAATGVFLMVYYVPTPDHAHASVEYLQSLPFGSVVRGLHHYGASAMVLFVGLHLLQAWFWGAYKKPRQIIWVTGVILLSITLVFSFTGYLLPWDQKAYWATVVGTNIAASIPLVGEQIMMLLRGGPDVGAATLTRFFAIHVILLPTLLVLGIVFHLYQVRKKGITPPWSRVGEEPKEKPVLFYPDQVFKDLVAILLVLGVLLVLAVWHGAPLEDPANPADTTYVPRPEWFFLPMFELLKHLPERYGGEFMGGVVIPTVAILLLILFPYIDRNPDRRPHRRPAAIGLAVGVFAITTFFGIEGLRSAPSQRPLNAIEARGEKIFMDLRCSSCHGVNGGGGTAGPDLATLEDTNPQRLAVWITNPVAFNERSIMPAYEELEEAEVNALVAYLRVLGPGSHMPRQPRVGPRRPASHTEDHWMLDHKYEVRKDPVQCSNCHEPSFCQTCHQNRVPDSHLEGWLKAHFGTAMEKPEYCAACHEQSYCNHCHGDTLHTPDWLTEHVPAVGKRPEICQECHRQESFCISCHRGAEPQSHVPNWVASHGAEIGAGKHTEESCSTCHSKSFCGSCHAGAKPKSHEARTFFADHGALALRTGQDCATCHSSDFCGSCHATAKPKSHSLEDFLKAHGALSREHADSCATCHTPERNSCDSCHGGLPLPHPPGYMLGHGPDAAKPDAPCANCHPRDYCAACHGTPPRR